MKKRDLKTLRGKSIEVLKKQLIDKKAEFVLTWIEVKSKKEKNVNKARNIKRDIAQLMTIIREKELIEEDKEKDIFEKEKTDSSNKSKKSK